jgi:hypothetical protein
LALPSGALCGDTLGPPAPLLPPARCAEPPSAPGLFTWDCILSVFGFCFFLFVTKWLMQDPAEFQAATRRLHELNAKATSLKV